MFGAIQSSLYLQFQLLAAKIQSTGSGTPVSSKPSGQGCHFVEGLIQRITGRTCKAAHPFD